LVLAGIIKLFAVGPDRTGTLRKLQGAIPSLVEIFSKVRIDVLVKIETNLIYDSGSASRFILLPIKTWGFGTEYLVADTGGGQPCDG
jgi:hypothetical protein